MNVARLNLSHGNVESHSLTLERVRQAAMEMDVAVAVMVDTRGREIRTGKLSTGSVLLERHQSFSIYAGDGIGDDTGVTVSHLNLYRHTGCR